MGLSHSLTPQNMTLDVAGLPVNYAAVGKGETVVFLHGWGGEIASFAPVFPRLAERFRVVALDLPGHGRTPPPPSPWGAYEHADFLASFLRQAQLAPCTLVGHSHGGRVSIALAACEPDLMSKLVLVDSAGIVPRRGPRYYFRVYSVKAVRKILSLPGLRAWRELLLSRLYRVIGSSDYNAAANSIMRATLVRVVNQDLRHLLPHIKAPTLLIWGDQDNDTPLADGQLMERLIPDAGLVIFEGAGHFAYLDRLDQFCRVVTHFVENA